MRFTFPDLDSEPVYPDWKELAFDLQIRPSVAQKLWAKLEATGIPLTRSRVVALWVLAREGKLGMADLADWLAFSKREADRLNERKKRYGKDEEEILADAYAEARERSDESTQPAA